ncbi:MAG TPA: hypothetical protein VFY32_18385, partial [Solirubrobacteraceae bacterium]|nr:hypothetical protein [Solirubrobacteraceae bacterium]
MKVIVVPLDPVEHALHERVLVAVALTFRRRPPDGSCAAGPPGECLVGHGRRHPDVDENDIGVAGVDRRRQLLAVRTHRDELDLVAVAEQARERLADEEAVVSHGDAHRHVLSVTPRRTSPQGGTPAGRPGVGTQPEASASASARKSSV